jgi:hypothetical protein
LMAKRKFGLITDTMTQSRISRMKMPSSFFMKSGSWLLRL